MSTELTTEEIEELREKSGKDVQRIWRELESDVPGINEMFGAITGTGIGGAASLAALSSLGFSGLSAAGITSGLATAGSLLGGGMVVGFGVLAAPVAVLGIAGYSIFKNVKEKNKKEGLKQAIDKLYKVKEKLVVYDQYFTEDISGISGAIKTLQTLV